MIAERLSAQLLAGARAPSPEDVVDRLLAVQAQDPRGARLSIRARTSGVAVTAVDSALSDRRSLLITWLCRGTLHLVQAADYWFLHSLTTPQLLPGNARRLAQEGVSPAQADLGVDVVVEQTAAGPKTRRELRDALDARRVPTAGQALAHVLFTASLRGHVIRGPMRGTEHCYVRAQDWLGRAPEPLDRPAALALLARRYLAGHGPARADDLAKWAGIGLREARAGFAGISDEVAASPDELVDLIGRPRPAAPAKPQLLGPFDPLLHGWVSRDFVVGDHKSIVTANGLFRPFALVDGRAVATWTLNSGRLTIHPLERIKRADLQELQADALAALRFLCLPETAAVVES